jgi:hypothetical protein
MLQRMLAPVHDRRGVALPLALVGLVIVSLLVTGALLTSTTEATISSAYVDGSRALYDADGGLQSYVADRDDVVLQPGVETIPVPGTTSQVRITTAQLRQTGGGADTIRRTFSITAQPMVGTREAGRAVVTMVSQKIPPPAFVNANITSAMTIGGDLQVKGNAFEVTGVSSACLPPGQNGVDAVRAAVGSEITVNNEKHYANFMGVDDNGNIVSGEAAIDRSDLTREELARNVLGGPSLAEMIAGIPLRKKWGPRFNRPRFDQRSPNANFMAPSDTVAVVDAMGGKVSLQGGSGLLIIVNGSLEMKGNASFQGIIIVEGNFELSGNPQVDGALISLAMDGNNSIELDDSAVGNGNITVQYDRCKINQAVEGMSRVASNQPPLTSRTFAWFELVR